MNRSFRANEAQMQGALKQRQHQTGGLHASVMKEKEEELALFLEMRKREKERNDLFLNNSDEFGTPIGSKPGTSRIFNISPSTPLPARNNGVDDFLNSENDKNDYDWLLTPPGTPLLTSLQMESRKTVMSQLGTPKARSTMLKSRLNLGRSIQVSNAPSKRLLQGVTVSKEPASFQGMNSSSSGVARSRAATPTGRPTLTTASKPSRSATPTSRPTLLSTKPIISSARTPLMTTKKASVASSNSSVPSRLSTLISRSTVRSSTPTSRPTIAASAPTSSISVPAVNISSTISKLSSTALRNPVVARGTSPTVKSRPWKASETSGFSQDAPPNLRTTLTERPLSATRGRSGAPSSRSSSVELVSNGRPRRQSCSPSRGHAPNGAVHLKASDNSNPVLVGIKLVERVINMRKLAPPKQVDKHSPHVTLSGKPSSPEGSGFGRTLSKKSLDMAIRHMDIRRSIPGNLRPLMTNIPAFSMHSVRSEPTRSRTISVRTLLLPQVVVPAPNSVSTTMAFV